jgi:AraC family transcriptional regulator
MQPSPQAPFQQPPFEHGAPVTVASVLEDLPDAPIATSRARDWGGVTLDLHAAVGDYHVETGAHDHHLICLCTKGSGRLIQRRDGSVHDSIIRAGTSIIMPSGMPSAWEGSAAMSARIRMSCQVLRNASLALGGNGDIDLLNRFEIVDPTIERLASLMLIELEQPPHPAQAVILESISTALAAHLWRSHNGFAPRRAPSPDTAEPAAIRRVVAFIHDHLEQPLTLTDLAQVAGVSIFHVVRQFRQATGQAPAAYVQGARIAWARRLIATTDTSLAQIALITGFADQSHFSRRFRHHTGTTPGAFAREHRRRPG